MGILRAFGANPGGEFQEKFKLSSQYKDGEFRNFSTTEMMTGNSSMLEMTWKFLNKPKATVPPRKLPSIHTDLLHLNHQQPALIWFGHSSFFIQVEGKNILVDPVFSGHASPFPFGVKSFHGTDIYTVDDLPEIDILLITHDHYDHLDHRTVKLLRSKVKQVCTSLGVGSHLEYWGFDRRIITEFDWNDEHVFFDVVRLTAAPARHFSGRSFKRNKTLWASYILEAGKYKIYIGADSGYDTHFKNIGQQFGGFDLALLETGQYNTQWPYIHMMPEEAVQAAIDLQAHVMMPLHWAKFALAFHDWDEPVKRVLKKAGEMKVKVTTPMIGQPVIFGASYPADHWWELPV